MKINNQHQLIFCSLVVNRTSLVPFNSIPLSSGHFANDEVVDEMRVYIDQRTVTELHSSKWKIVDRAFNSWSRVYLSPRLFKVVLKIVGKVWWFNV